MNEGAQNALNMIRVEFRLIKNNKKCFFLAKITPPSGSSFENLRTKKQPKIKGKQKMGKNN